MYLHHQKEAQNRCHWSRIYSADSELIPCWRISLRCCAACAGPSRQSRGRRNCTRPSCTAGRRRAVPRVEVKSLNQSRLSSGTSYRIVFLVCSCYSNSLRKVYINTNFPLCTSRLISCNFPQGLSLLLWFVISISAKNRNPLLTCELTSIQPTLMDHLLYAWCKISQTIIPSLKILHWMTFKTNPI